MSESRWVAVKGWPYEVSDDVNRRVWDWLRTQAEEGK